MTTTDPQSDLRTQVREHYAQAARRAAAGTGACCGPAPLATGLGAALYDRSDHEVLPDLALSASLGCGNPTAVADLRPGERVLDLGSGAGIDVLLSARRVGPTGFVYGLDMTEEMLELARRNATEAGIDNVAFLRGEIEQIPLPDASVDVIVSNCVINLSTDKPAALTQAHRVLVPGGRLGISDIIADDDLTPQQRAERGPWAGCIAGALTAGEYEQLLADAGFRDVSIVRTHEVMPGMSSAIIKAVRPAGG